MSTKAEFEWISCNNCGHKTKHHILASVSQEDSELHSSGNTLEWEDIYQILQCGGCDSVTYRSRAWFSEWDVDWDDEPYPRCYRDSYFPPLAEHVKPQWFNKLNKDLQQILEELYTAFQNNLYFLTAVATRTALDIAIVEKIGDIGSFQEKIKKLEKDGMVTHSEKDLLEAIIEAGSAAAHRGYRPNINDLLAVVQILENILYKLYIYEDEIKALTKSASELKMTVPPRKK